MVGAGRGSEPADEDVGALGGTWRELPTTLNVQDFSASLFWTGDALITLRPENEGHDVTGEIYRPADGSVRQIAPSGLEWRAFPAVAWTGEEVIVAGGSNGPGIYTAAAAYNPGADTWRELPAPPGFSPGGGGVIGDPAVWTGQEMIAWQSNLAFSPGTDTWRTIPPAPLQRRMDEAVVATEHGVFVWGGCSTDANPQCDELITGDELSDGAIYDRRTDSWTELPDSPLGPGDHPTAVWTGDEVIVVVNAPADPEQAQAAAYNPASRQWRTLPSSPHPGGRYAVTVWNGQLAITHGGLDPHGRPTGATTALDPAAGRWLRLPVGPPRDRHAAAWAGDRLVITAGSPSFTPWELQLDIADHDRDPGRDPSPTTRPEPTAPPPEPEQSAPDVEHVDGSHRGTEHYALATVRCPFLDHELESTFDLTGGPTWQYHAEYCGEVDGDLWTGIGTFVITAPDGSTLTGTLTSSARLPTDSEPYELTITGGTKRFDGASGSCRLDNHLTVIDFGLQEQFGTFTCDVAT